MAPTTCRSICRITIAICALLIAVTPKEVLASQSDVLERVSFEPQLGKRLPSEIFFYDHRERRVALSDVVAERPTVICLVYFQCPMLCGLTADGLKQSLRQIPEGVGEDFNVAVISFDPRDTAKRASQVRAMALRDYGRPGADAGWWVLTGKESSIKQLTEAVGFNYCWDDSLKQYAHPAGLVIVGTDGTLTSYLSGVHFPPRELATAIHDARNGVVAEAAPESFMRCYLYDPTTGKFGLLVVWVLRGLGAATVVVLSGGIMMLIRRESCIEDRAHCGLEDE